MTARTAVGRGVLGGAACAACCAPPIVAALGVAGGLAATIGIFVGLAAAIAIVLVAGTWIVARLRRPACDPGAVEPVAVAAPARRSTG